MRHSLVLLSFALAACPASGPPGDEVMGTFNFVATPQTLNCALRDVTDAGFEFSATLSRQKDGGTAYFTINELSREARWDGQFFSSSGSAERVFTECMVCRSIVGESLNVALLSKSQFSASGDMCPADAYADGGIPTGEGVIPPDSSPTGFDAVGVCGSIQENVSTMPKIDGGVCPEICNQCNLTYTITGSRI